MPSKPATPLISKLKVTSTGPASAQSAHPPKQMGPIVVSVSGRVYILLIPPPQSLIFSHSAGTSSTRSPFMNLNSIVDPDVISGMVTSYTPSESSSNIAMVPHPNQLPCKNTPVSSTCSFCIFTANVTSIRSNAGQNSLSVQVP